MKKTFIERLVPLGPYLVNMESATNVSVGIF